jgi:uncharacterized protein YjdB
MKVGVVSGTALLLSTLTLGCGDDAAAPTAVVSITLTPTLTLSMRKPSRLSPEFRNRDGNTLTDVNATWASSNTSVVQVAGDGSVLGKALGGPVMITVTADGRSASTAITIIPDLIEITPATATLLLGSSRQLTATARDFEGGLISNPGSITWNSSNIAVATVDQAGVLTSVAPGNTVIQAIVAGRTSPRDIEVGVPGPYDAHWIGTSTTPGQPSPRIYPIEFDVLFGRARAFRFT